MKKYETILQELKRHIQDGVYESGLPSECRLAQEYGVAPLTARKALDVLAGEGIIIRSPGKVAQVNYEKIRPINICLCCNREMLDEITHVLSCEFPGVAFRLENDPALRLSGKYDITHITTTFPDRYELHFQPFPEETIRRIKESDGLRHESLELHHVNERYYGLPIVYSPSVLEVNCVLLKQLGLNLPEWLDYTALKQCRERLGCRSDAPALFDTNYFAELLMFQMLYDHIPAELTILKRDDWLDIYARVLNEYVDLSSVDIGRDCDFQSGRALFRFVGRGFAREQLDFETKYFASGKGPIVQVHAFSESLVISRQASDPERLASICLAFLGSEIQQILCRHQRSIPVNKAAAYETFCQSSSADQIFMREDRRCMFARPAHLRELNGTIWNAVPQYIKGQLDASGFSREVLDHLRFQFKQETIMARFWQEQAHPREAWFPLSHEKLAQPMAL